LYDSSLLFFPLITRLQEEIKIAKNKILRWFFYSCLDEGETAKGNVK
jgi:hypothetical protein